MDDDTAPQTLYDFSRPEAVAAFDAIDDRVMGGVSDSRLVATDAGAAFVGAVSFERGGGFCSVRSERTERDLRGARGIALRVRGDGKRYKVCLRDRATFDGVNHEVAIAPPAGAWVVERLPFDRLAPVWRGDAVPESPPLDLAHVETVGLLISDRQEGPFRLEIAWIRTYYGDDPT